jgi:hypothetical protein
MHRNRIKFTLFVKIDLPMDEAVSKYDLTKRELARGRNLKIGAVAAPIVLGGTPALTFLLLAFLFGTTPPAAVTIFFFGAVLTALGFAAGLILTGIFLYRHTAWSREIREKIAADGIRAEEIDWFRNELRSSEKKALRDIGRSDLLLADAYRETLASRLTASRIIRSSRRELSLVQRRKAKLSQLKTSRAEEFKEETENDARKLAAIHEEAKQMLAESEARLQMIEAAAVRGRSVVDSELALKKLSARSKDLPLALEEAKMKEQLVAELEADLSGDAPANRD